MRPFEILTLLFLIWSLISFFIYFSSNYLGEWGKTRIVNERLRIKHTQEGMEGIKEIKLENAEDMFIQKFSLANFLTLRSQAKHTTLIEVPRFGIELIALISIILIFITP